MQSRNLKDFFIFITCLILEPPEIISEFQYILGFEDKILILDLRALLKHVTAPLMGLLIKKLRRRGRKSVEDFRE